MKIHYFAWMREHTQCAQEMLSVPAHVTNVEALIEHLRALSEGHANALRNIKTVRVAVNQQYAQLDTAITDADEIAFFPPVTGG